MSTESKDMFISGPFCETPSSCSKGGFCLRADIIDKENEYASEGRPKHCLSSAVSNTRCLNPQVIEAVMRALSKLPVETDRVDLLGLLNKREEAGF